jgi:glutamate-1-semialdehyde 2,1-aminomutase
LNGLARELGVSAQAYGEPLPAMPFFRFTDPDPERAAALTRWFYREVLARGVLLHPRHLWFIAGAHTADDIRRTLDVCRTALQATLSLLG